jgi:hypothetical protein
VCELHEIPARLRIALDRPREQCGRLAEFGAADEQAARKARQHHRVLGRERLCAAQVFDPVVDAPERHQRHAQFAPHAREPGPRLENAPEDRDRALVVLASREVISLLRTRRRQLDLRAHVAGVDGGRALEEDDGAVE